MLTGRVALNKGEVGAAEGEGTAVDTLVELGELEEAAPPVPDAEAEADPAELEDEEVEAAVTETVSCVAVTVVDEPVEIEAELEAGADPEAEAPEVDAGPDEDAAWGRGAPVTELARSSALTSSTSCCQGSQERMLLIELLLSVQLQGKRYHRRRESRKGRGELPTDLL